MSATNPESVSAAVASLTKSFRLVPSAAVPAIIDCVLASTGVSPSSLFISLLDKLSNFTKDLLKEANAELESDCSGYVVSYMTALCHLLKKSGAESDLLRLFMWRGFLPLLKIIDVNNFELINQTAELLCDVVIESDNWGLIGSTLVPFCLRAMGLCVGLVQSEDLAIHQWSMPTFIQGLESESSEINFDQVPISLDYGSLQLSTVCHILTSVLAAALNSCQIVESAAVVRAVDQHSAEDFARRVLLALSDMAIHMISQCPEYRSCATQLLLPCIFRALDAVSSFEVLLNGSTHVCCRDDFPREVWKCCCSLFSLGMPERRDAFCILSLYLSYLFPSEGFKNGIVRNVADGFDIRAEKLFWDEVRRGLVDKDSLVRKQSLHILKISLGQNSSRFQSEGCQCKHVVSCSNGCDDKQSLTVHCMTKREKWAQKEAKSLGLGQMFNVSEPCLNSQQRWEVFVLLYEMLEEYGAHLVEAAWSHQVSLLLCFPGTLDTKMDHVDRVGYQHEMETSRVFNWLALLWERGFCHDNPQVRCLIMQSFLSIDWENNGNYAKSVPESFIVGAFIQGLNDPIHHKDFGLKGFYCSEAIGGASKFLRVFSGYLSNLDRITFMCRLASVARQDSFGRAGLMALAVCIASMACDRETCYECGSHCGETNCPGMTLAESDEENFPQNCRADLLDALRIVLERSKQHFNANYRIRACDQVLDAATSVMRTCDVPLDVFLLFISSIPREFTDYGGTLRHKVQQWFSRCRHRYCSSNPIKSELLDFKNLCDFPQRFIRHHHSSGSFIYFDDDELSTWGFEAQRWARVLFLAITEEQHLEPIFMFLQNYGTKISSRSSDFNWVPLKFLLLISSLVQELQIVDEKSTYKKMDLRAGKGTGTSAMLDQQSATANFVVREKFYSIFLFLLKDMVSYASSSSSIFWCCMEVNDTALPSSVKGKLGGPSQRRLASSTTVAVLQAISSIKTLAYVTLWCSHMKNNTASLDPAFHFFWDFSCKVTSHPIYDSETRAEVHLAAYEALVHVLKALFTAFCPLALGMIVRDNSSAIPGGGEAPILDSLVLNFLQKINDLLAVGTLARSRLAVLMDWKWLCLVSLLSIPYYIVENGVHLGSTHPLLSDTALTDVFGDLVDSLENAGESSVLPILRSVRLVLGLFCSTRMHTLVSTCNGINSQMMLQLVHSSWILHVSCNKRRIAPIAALFSSVLHSSVFGDLKMHQTLETHQGPLKWFIERILDEGLKSPRTVRLAALHLTGLWLLYPKTIKYYIKELKLLSLYGSVAFDEDFEGELVENHEVRMEVSLLAKNPEPELAEVFINTEMYARVCVAVLFQKLANLAESSQIVEEDEHAQAALHSGKLFLLELLDSVVNDKDLSKELYKKYSGVHRRKVRAWQMICVLSRFVDKDVVQKVTSSLHICLYEAKLVPKIGYGTNSEVPARIMWIVLISVDNMKNLGLRMRNNLPAVRQYLEIFAIKIYLAFPALAEQQLIPIFHDYNMRSQALASYVFIASKIILHANEVDIQLKYIEELLPPMVPFLTSHHHSLRAFTQLLLYHVLWKLMPALNPIDSEAVALERKCFMDLKSYLTENSDCARLRASMGGILDSFDPNSSATPHAIFIAKEELDFECVPTSLMEQVINFLNDAREDLRCSMTKDVITIKNENLVRKTSNGSNSSGKINEERLSALISRDASLDFQKKVTLHKHDEEIQEEDELLNSVIQSRISAMQRIRESRQSLILVASLLDRIPNLAGLARTCEVFKAAALTVADASILHDKQFQLISVTAEKWVPVIEVPPSSMKVFLEKKKHEGFSLLGLEQTANSVPLDKFSFPSKTVLVLGREKEGIPVDIIHFLDACIEIPQLGVVRSLNVHVSGAIALWEYTRQQRAKQQ